MSKSGMMAGAMALAAVASPAMAQTQGGERPVRVAIIDIQPDRLDCRDDNAKLIDVTPELPSGMREAVGKSGRTSHGVVVATAFVEEIRKIDRTVPIEVYTLNPFIKHGGTGEMMFSKAMLRKGLENLEGKGISIAVTTFSVSDQTEGQKIADMFKARGMKLFAATPNETNDPGIYPAASQGVIAIAQDGGGRSVAKDRRYQEFTKFVFPGSYVGRSAEVVGSSFSTPRAAAYAAYMDWKQPGISEKDILATFDRTGWEVSGMPKGIKFSGGKELVEAVRAMPSSGAPVQMASMDVDSTRTAPSPAVRMAAMAGGMGVR